MTVSLNRSKLLLTISGLAVALNALVIFHFMSFFGDMLALGLLMTLPGFLALSVIKRSFPRFRVDDVLFTVGLSITFLILMIDPFCLYIRGRRLEREENTSDLG